MKPIKHTIQKVAAISALASAIAFTSLAFAQQDDQTKHCKNKGPDRLVVALNIQNSQKEGFDSIMQAQHDKRRALREQYNDVREQEKEAMQTLRASTLSSLESILTEQQLENFKAITTHNRSNKKAQKHMKGPQKLAKHKKNNDDQGHKVKGKKTSERMIATLGLDNEKADAFRSLMKSQGEQRHTIRQQYKSNHQAEHEAMKALFEDTLVQLESVLNDQQIDNLKAIKKHNRRA